MMETTHRKDALKLTGKNLKESKEKLCIQCTIEN